MNNSPPPSAVAAQARLLVLLRLLLLAIGLGALSLFLASHGARAISELEQARWLLVVVCLIAATLAASVGLVRHRWQLALHLVFDVIWIGLLIYWTGGVASPAVVLLFAAVLIGNLILPGFLPFVMPALGGMILSIVAACYLSDRSPFPPFFVLTAPDLFFPGRVLGNLAVQVGALFLVELLGGLLVRRLVESRVFAGGVLDQLGEGVLAVDRAGHIAYVNAEAARLLGLAGPPAAGTDGSLVLAEPGLAAVRNLLSSVRLPVVERWRAPSGRQLVLRVTELHGRRNQVIGRTMVIADETRLRTLEDSMRRSEGLAVLGEMAAGIAHEVRNPLTSLRGCAQELAEVALNSGRADDARLAKVIVSESDRLARIVGDFLELSRMRAPVRVHTELLPVVEEVRTLIASRDDAPPGLRIVLGIDEDCPPIHVDPDQFRQVLINLAVNALEALRGRPAPTIAFRAALAGEDNPLSEDALRLSVIDSGIGIPRDQIERVFTPFWSTKPQGTGLGLSVVSRIIREHEGVLRIDSEPGTGTEVQLYLPIVTQSRSFKRALGGG